MNEDGLRRIKIEKRALMISMYGSLFFVFAESFMAVASSSQSILLDAVYGSADLLMVILSIRIVPLLYRPTTEKRSFGLSQVESIFIVMKGSMLTAVTVGLMLNNIQVILRGGNHLNFKNLAIFEFIAAIICLGVLFYIKRINKSINSPMVKTEVGAWIIDSMASVGLCLAFLLPEVIRAEWMRELAPYLDQVIAIVLAVTILPIPIKTVLHGLRDIFLLAPEEDMISTIKEIGQSVLPLYHIEPTVYDIIKTGRKLWVSIYFTNQNDLISITAIKKAHNELELELKKKFPDLYAELIPEFED
ncbi:MAG: cation transporter [Clostridia bacterium]|nr:cation transporter [Clostridia bacterium]